MRQWILCNVFRRHLPVRFCFEDGTATDPYCHWCGRNV